jgi:hypothetical protein
MSEGQHPGSSCDQAEAEADEAQDRAGGEACEHDLEQDAEVHQSAEGER